MDVHILRLDVLLGDGAQSPATDVFSFTNNTLQYVYLSLPADPWTGYPHIPLAAPAKLYYLWQMGFYLHSILVLNAEARRKDHWQMMAHHIVTVALMTLSYTYNFTRVGCAILVMMDCCDFIFPVRLSIASLLGFC